VANNSITLAGSNYVRLPNNSDFQPENELCIELDLSLPDWSQENSSQIVGNFSNQGYGLFYQSGLSLIDEVSILDCGNSHLFYFNKDNQLVSQRDFPNQPNPINFTTHTIDRNGNKYYFDQGNEKIFVVDPNNLITLEIPTPSGSTINTVQVDSNGFIYILDITQQSIVKYDQSGTQVQITPLSEPTHTNFTINSKDEVVSFFSNPCTPMLVDCDDTTYNAWGVNIYRNAEDYPWFYVGENFNGFGIDYNDNIWSVYEGNRIVKTNKRGSVLFDKQFHQVVSCETDPCDNSVSKVSIGFTREQTTEGIQNFTWVLLEDSNYILKLDSEANILACVLLTGELDIEKYPNTSYSNSRMCLNGPLNSFYDSKKYDVSCGFNLDTQLVFKIAIEGSCENDIVIKQLSTTVTSLIDGSHNIKIQYSGLTGLGRLFVDGVEVDRFNQKGKIYYDTGNKRPTLIGADSGNFRSRQEELGVSDPVYFRGVVNNLYMSGSLNSIQPFTVNNSPINMEFPIPYRLSFKEKVDKLFLMRSGGFKSSRLKLQIKNSGLGDVKNELEKEVTERINNVVPTQTVIHDTEWKEEIRLKDLMG